MPRQCLFCSAVANSREHVIAQWLSAHAGMRSDQLLPAHFSETVGLQLHNQENPRWLGPGQFTAKFVCAECNNGWMSQLEGWAQQNLGDFLLPTWKRNYSDGLERFQGSPEELIRWLLKTAIVFELSIPAGQTYKVHESFRRVAKGDVPATDLYVFGACTEDKDFNFHLRRGYMVWNGGQLRFQSHERSFDYCIQINHSLLRLVSCPDAKPWVRNIWKAPYHIVPVLMSKPNTPIVPTDNWFGSFEEFERFLEIVPN